MSFKLSGSSLDNLEGVHPDLAWLIHQSLSTSVIDFGVSCGVRTAREQNDYYNDPKVATNCDGYKTLSKHQVRPGERYGMAVDLFAYINGGANWDDVHIGMIGGHILANAKKYREKGIINIEVTWGATFGSDDFNGWDKSHFECREIA